MTTSTTWQRRTGLVTSSRGHADRAVALLEETLVLAFVESEPETPEAVTITVAADEQDRVAVVDRDGTEVVPGPTLAALAESLAEACDGRVAFDDVAGGVVEEPLEEDPRDPFDPEIDVVSAYVPDRAVVHTRAGVEDLTALATVLDMPILAAPHRDGHLVLVTDGPALSAVEWPEALKPALVLEEGAAYPAVAVVDGGTVHLHTWDTDVVLVPRGADLDPAVRAFADATLGTGALIELIARLVPEVGRAVLRAALDGSQAGPAALIAALDLPPELVGYLGHGAGAPILDGARTFQPDRRGQVWARAVSGAVNDASVQMSESVRERTEHMRERAELMRERADAARVRAESAFDAAETFTEEVVVPIRQSWWTPAVAGVEVAAAGLVLYRAGRGARAGTGTSAGERVLAIAGALLLVDAVVNTVVFVVPRLKKDL